MVARRDGWTDAVRVLALNLLIALPLGGLILYQGADIRSEIRGLRGEIEDLHDTVHKHGVVVARMEARRSLRPGLALRFVASGEGASYGGPGLAADLLLERALPEIDATLSTLDKDAEAALPNDLWEHRATILARGDPIP